MVDETSNRYRERKFKCWAAPCGGCGDGPSREHLLSNCLFPDGVVRVKGFDWCKDETKTVGINGLARQILCKKHNSALSNADAEAKKAVGLFQQSVQAGSGPAANNRVDGHILERWLLKTAINTAYGGNWHIGVGMHGSIPGLPPPYLIDVAFGKLPFSHKMGAYFLFPKKETLHDPGAILSFPLVKDGCIGGFYFELRTQPVFLNLFPGHAPPALGEVAEGLELQRHLLDADLIYRPPNIVTTPRVAPPSVIYFDW